MRWFRCGGLAVAIAACSTGSGAKHEDGSATMPPKELPKPPPAAPDAMVTVGSATVSVEVVSTEAKIERGLMYREHVPPDRGMLFLMNQEYDWAFWMRNTLIPLDIIFIRKDMTVAGIAANAKPKDETLLRVGVPSLFVLEVNAGWAAAHAVKPGTPVRFENVR
jgi:uncharacterized membrane protein (UPF0127 family)